MFAATLTVAARLTLAQDPSVLEWSAPKGCPSATQVHQVLARLLPTGVGRTSLRARAAVEQHYGGFTLELELVTSSGRSTRRLQDPRCETLATAVAFLVAVAIDPVSVAVAAMPSPESQPRPALEPRPGPDPQSPPLTLPPPPPPPSPPSPPSPPLSPPPASELEPNPTVKLERFVPPRDDGQTRPRLNLSGAIRAFTAVGIGSVPDVDIGAGALGAVTGRHWRAELGFMHVFTQPVRLNEAAESGANVSLWTGVARACGVIAAGRWIQFPLCAHLEGGAIRAQGIGVELASVETSGWFALGGAAALAFAPVRTIALWAELHGFGTPLRPQFVVNGASETLYLAPRGGIRGALGLEIRFQ